MQRSMSFFRWLTAWLLFSILGVGILGGAGLSARAAPKQQNALDVIINEVAWGGTIASPDTDEWIELYNTSATPINFNGEWLLISEETPPKINIALTGSIASNGYYLLERQNDSVIDTISADQIYSGPGNLLDDEGDTLILYAPDGAGGYITIDTINIDGGAWPAGNSSGYGSMERYGKDGSSDGNWVTNSNPDPANNMDFRGNLIYGTPRSQNWASTITPITTTTITSDSPDPSSPGLPVNIAVSVTGGPTIPEGSVKIITGNQSCSFPLKDGKGNCNVTYSTIGSKTITATYNPTSNHTSSSDTEEHEVVNGILTTTTITNLNPENGTVNKNILVSVKVDPSSGSTKPTGTVSITGANTNCDISLSNGAGSCNVRFNSIGVKTLTATYKGGGVFISSNTTKTVDIFLESETTITRDNPDPSNRNQAVTVNVTVTGDNNVPTGEVEITGATSNCTITLSNGSGSCNVNFSSSGTKTIKATYIGDDLYGSSSDTVTHIVSFSTSGGSSSGSSGTVTLPPILGISEFLPRPGYDWNNDGVVDVFDEFIEIINAGQIDVNLSSYSVDDEEKLGSAPYTLPSITLKPGERAVFYAAETGILLSDAGDTVRLLRGNTVVDAYTYGIVHRPNQAWCRIPDRLGYWNDPCFPTPNNPNALTGNNPSPPEFEIGYHPQVCFLSDTTPEEFIYAECKVGGDKIWSRRYWDKADDTKHVKLEYPPKWEIVFE